MRKQRRPAVRIGLTVVMIAVLAVTVSRDHEEPWVGVYDQAVAAAGEGDWPTAWVGFRRVFSCDPDYRDVSVRAMEAARHLVQQDGLALEVEIEMLRWFGRQGDTASLVAVLDRSMAEVPAGWGWMGSEARHEQERPRRRVYLDAFRIDRYEVTNAQYKRYLAWEDEAPPVYWAAGSYPPGQEDRPILGVSWRQADEYCRWAGKRLPTEAEWERACRGVAGSVYPWGETWDPTLANIQAHTLVDLDETWTSLAANVPVGGAFPVPVGTHPSGASIFGVVDLVGNASEWVADWYDPTAYERLPDVNPVGDGPPWEHVVRGSAWIVPFSVPEYAADFSRCAFRNASHSYDNPQIGFRCAASGT